MTLANDVIKRYHELRHLRKKQRIALKKRHVNAEDLQLGVDFWHYSKYNRA